MNIGTLIIDIQQIKNWREQLDSHSIKKTDLDVVDFLISEFEESIKSQEKNKCSSCSYWNKSSETEFGFCHIGKGFFVGNNKCGYGTWKPKKDTGELLREKY